MATKILMDTYNHHVSLQFKERLISRVASKLQSMPEGTHTLSCQTSGILDRQDITSCSHMHSAIFFAQTLNHMHILLMQFQYFTGLLVKVRSLQILY